MQKLNVSVESKNKKFLNYVKNRLCLKDDITINSGRAFITVGRNQLYNLPDVLSEVIINDYKADYLKGKLNLPIENEYNKQAFIKALTTFDRDSDKILCMEKLIIDTNAKDFYLDSFFNFKLQGLRRRWDEVCKLANENTSFLVCSETFSELLKFLIKNLESRCNEVHLFKNNDKYELLNNCLKPIKNIYSNEEFSVELDLVTNLISLAPRKIILHLDTNQRDEAINFICNIFENNVEIINV